MAASQPLKRAYDPKDSLWKLQVLADFGLRQDDARIAAIAGGFLRLRRKTGASYKAASTTLTPGHPPIYVHLARHDLHPARLGTWKTRTCSTPTIRSWPGSAWTAVGIRTS